MALPRIDHERIAARARLALRDGDNRKAAMLALLAYETATGKIAEAKEPLPRGE